jgi:hexosaminidase
LIGWDEILEGGLAPNAVVMSWRGEQGGIIAAKQKHEVIMTPGNYVYLDHSQTKNEDSVTIGSYTSVQQTYSYEPQSKELTAEQAKFIMGAQGNVWTEYMAYPSKVEYMIFPRASALSEVLWSPKEKRNVKDFEKRLQTQFRRYQLWKANYSKAFFELNANILPSKSYNGVVLQVTAKNPTDSIYGVEQNPHSYAKNKLIKGKGQVTLPVSGTRNFYFEQKTRGERLSTFEKHIEFSRATGKKIRLTTEPGSNFPGEGGAFGLVNGILSEKGQNSSEWLGWQGEDLEAIIDLGSMQKVSHVDVHVLTARGSQPCKPQFLEVSTSTSGAKYDPVGRSTEIINDSLNMGRLALDFSPLTTRFIIVKVKNFGTIPDGMPGAGNKAWLYADEIQVE